MKAFLRSCLVLGLFASVACVTSPNQGSELYLDFDDVGSLYLEGYADGPNQLLDVQLKDWTTGRFDTVAQLRSASTRTFPANSFGQGSPALYFYSGTSGQPITVVAPWIPNNARHLGDSGIQVRVVKTGTENALWGGTAEAEACMIAGYNTSRTVQQLGLACGYTLSAIDVGLVYPIP